MNGRGSFKICFIGLGSIAKRHIKNLHSLLGENADITVVRSGKGKEIEDEIGAMISDVIIESPEKNRIRYNGMSALTELTKHYEVVFITNPTAIH